MDHANGECLTREGMRRCRRLLPGSERTTPQKRRNLLAGGDRERTITAAFSHRRRVQKRVAIQQFYDILSLLVRCFTAEGSGDGSSIKNVATRTRGRSDGSLCLRSEGARFRFNSYRHISRSELREASITKPPYGSGNRLTPATRTSSFVSADVDRMYGIYSSKSGERISSIAP